VRCKIIAVSLIGKARAISQFHWRECIGIGEVQAGRMILRVKILRVEAVHHLPLPSVLVNLPS